MPVGEESQLILTWNTHKGLFKVKRLPYGVASAPAIFQSFVETILKGLPSVRVLLDDVLGSAGTRRECFILLLEVLRRFALYNVKVRLNKCQLLLQSVVYLGHVVSSEGLRPLSSRIADVLAIPPPRNVTELQSFMGLVNWQGKFLPRLAAVAAPLHRLVRAATDWVWDSDCERAFAEIKRLVTSSDVLVPYRLDLPLRLTCDASPHGLSGILSHVIEGQERVIAYASHALSPAERNYAQIMREAAAILFSVRRFYRYLVGRPFELVTDNKALAAIFGSKRGLSQTTIGRLQRWALMLGGFQYTITHRPGSDIPHADALSRHPAPAQVPIDAEVLYVAWSDIPVTGAEVVSAMSTDRVLRAVCRFVRDGWPTRPAPSLLPFWHRRDELSVEDACLFWGSRLIVPEQLRASTLATLHEAHPGVCRMKSLARGHVWWPTLDGDIETLARECLQCQRHRDALPSSGGQPWPAASRPWERVHVDHGSYRGHILLVLVDAFSRWPEVKVVPSTDAPRNIDVLRGFFAAYGFPEVLCSDNGPPFSSAAFRAFLASTGTAYINAPPGRPQANGLAEKMVGTVKAALRKIAPAPSSGRQLQVAIDTFLLSYRSVPHTTTGKSPSSLFLLRESRSRLSLLRPLAQPPPSGPPVVPALLPYFKLGDAVLVRLADGAPWEPAVVKSRHGQATYVISLRGRDHFCHRAVMRPCPERLRPGCAPQLAPSRGRRPATPSYAAPLSFTSLPSTAPGPPPPSPGVNSPSTPPRRSVRHRTAPVRLEYGRGFHQVGENAASLE